MLGARAGTTATAASRATGAEYPDSPVEEALEGRPHAVRCREILKLSRRLPGSQKLFACRA